MDLWYRWAPSILTKYFGLKFKIEDEIDLFECKALGFDPTVEKATSDSICRLGRGTKPNESLGDLNPTYCRLIEYRISKNCGTNAMLKKKNAKEPSELAEGVNVRIIGKLRRFIEEQASPNGLYESASEYVRDLIRRDYQRQEERKWAWLMDQLRPGMDANESEFVPLDPEGIIKSAKKEKARNAA